MFLDFEIPKNEVDAMGEMPLDEKIYQIVNQSFDKVNDGTYSKWDIHDIKEVEGKYIAVLNVETTTEQVACQDCQDVATSECQKEECCEECGCPNEDSVIELATAESTKSVSYEGPWENKKFELDVAQMAAIFEVIQFCDYMVKRTQMVTPVAARSLQECQKIILENLTDFDVEKFSEQQIDPNKEAIEIKIKDEFAVHLKKYQEESVKIFEELVSEMEKKPQIVTANMIPQQGFDPKGPANFGK